MEVSHLQVKVTSDGIDKVSRGLGGLGKSAENAEKKVNNLTSAVDKLIGKNGDLVKSQGSATQAAQNQLNAFQALQGSLLAISKHMQDMANAASVLAQKQNQLTTNTNQTSESFRGFSHWGSVAISTLKAMATYTGAVNFGRLTKSIVESGDSWLAMRAKLSNATGTMKEAVAVQGDLFEMAQRLRVPLADMTKLYTRMAVPMEKMGMTAAQTRKQVEFVALALKLGGASAEEASSTMLQYSQSINAGRLNGAEFNAVAEAAPLILRAVEAELNATSRWSKSSGENLKKMGSEGSISLSLLQKAAERALPEFRRQFANLPITVDDAFTRIKNAWTKTVGELVLDKGTNARIVESIKILEENLPEIAAKLVSALAFVVEHLKSIAFFIGLIATSGLVAWTASAVRGLLSMAAAANAAAASARAAAAAAAAAGTAGAAAGAGMTAGAAAAGIARVALGALGGPLGLILTLLGAGATAWALWGRSAENSVSTTKKTLLDETNEVITQLNRQIEKYEQRNKLAKLVGEKLADSSDDNQQALNKVNLHMQNLVAEIASGAADKRKGGRAEAIKELEQWATKYGELKEAIKKADAAAAPAKAAAKLAEQKRVMADFNKTFADSSMKAASAIEEWTQRYEDAGIKIRDESGKLTKEGEKMMKLIHEKYKDNKPDHKAENKAAAALRQFEEEQRRILDNIEALDEKRAGLKNFWSDAAGVDTLPETKTRIKYQKELQDLEASHKGTALQLYRARTLVSEAMAAEERALNLRTVENNLKVQKQLVDATNERAAAINREAEALERKNATEGMTDKQARAGETDKLQEQIDLLKVARDYTEDETLVAGITQKINAVQALIDALRRLGEAADVEKSNKALQKLDDMLDPKKAERFGQAFTNSFGKIGKSAGGLLDAFTRIEKRQERMKDLNKEYEEAKKKNAAKADSYVERINEERFASEMAGYADILGATKGFFDEKTKGYKALEAAEKVYRAFEFAMEMKAFLTKSGLLATFTGLFVAAKETEMWTDETATGLSILNSEARSQANATEAVTNQGKGDPYSAFARIAAMAAIMAALGFATGAFGGGSVPSAPKTNTGTGTVFGDPEAKSESLAHSIDLLKDVDTMTMKYSAAMLSSLQNIETLLGGVTNLVLRTAGMTTGSNFGIPEFTIKNKGDPLTNAIGLGHHSMIDDLDPGGLLKVLHGLWGSVKQEVEQAGVQLKGSFAQLSQGKGMEQFANIKVTEKSFFGLSKDVHYDTRTGPLNDVVRKQFSLVIASFGDAIKAAAGPLGVNLDTLEGKINSFTKDLGQIDFKGLTGEQIQEKLAAVFGAYGDELAKAVIPGLDKFQKVGEGYLETLVRVSSGIEQANFELDKLGISATNLAALTDYSDDVGGALVKKSILFYEMSQRMDSGVSEIVQTLTGSAQDIAEAYGSLVETRRLMKNVGLGEALNRDLLKAAGGLDAFKDALSTYQDRFFNDDEKQAMRLANLQEDFGKLGLAVPATSAAFRELIQKLYDDGNTSLYAKVLLLSGEFADWAEVMTEGTEKVQDARNDLTEAYEREKDALEQTKDKFQDFTKSLKEFRQGLVTGSMSPLSNTEKYATLKAQFETTSAAALGGDEDAISKFQDVANEFLQFSREFNASGAGYNEDFQRVLDETAALEQYTAGRVSVAEQQLDALNKQVEGLIEVNESVLTVAQAIANLQAALAPAAPATVSPGTTVPAATSSVPATPDASTALAAQLGEVTAQLQALREENAQQAAMLAQVTLDSNQANADSINGNTPSGTLVFDQRQQQWDGF